MDASNSKVAGDTRQADVLEQLARDMVGSIDRILEFLMKSTPSVDGIDGEISLTFQEMRAFKTIEGSEPITMSALARSLKVSLPTATHIVDRLVAKGVAQRTRPDSDRRLVLVALSERATACSRALLENRVATVSNILDPLEPAARERVVKALGEVARVVESHEARQAEQVQSHDEKTINETERRPG
jgi:DNA-binding MarR family transcriptional regulator